MSEKWLTSGAARLKERQRRSFALRAQTKSAASISTIAYPVELAVAGKRKKKERPPPAEIGNDELLRVRLITKENKHRRMIRGHRAPSMVSRSNACRSAPTARGRYRVGDTTTNEFRLGLSSSSGDKDLQSSRPLSLEQENSRKDAAATVSGPFTKNAFRGGDIAQYKTKSRSDDSTNSSEVIDVEPYPQCRKERRLQGEKEEVTQFSIASAYDPFGDLDEMPFAARPVFPQHSTTPCQDGFDSLAESYPGFLPGGDSTTSVITSKGIQRFRQNPHLNRHSKICAQPKPNNENGEACYFAFTESPRKPITGKPEMRFFHHGKEVDTGGTAHHQVNFTRSRYCKGSWEE